MGTFLGYKCSGECCVCASAGGCISEYGDDNFYPATYEKIIKRLDEGKYPMWQQYMIDELKRRGIYYKAKGDVIYTPTPGTRIASFTVPLTPISKKNSLQVLINKATGRPFISQSPQYKRYEKEAIPYIPRIEKPIDYPVNVECRFYMPTRRKCDLTNMLSSIDDVLVRAGLLEDDNYTIVQSHNGSYVQYDKNRPRTEICITRADVIDV